MADTVTISEPRSLAVATIMARKGVNEAAIEAAVRLAAPSQVGRSAPPALDLIATGPGVWLALTDEPGEAWPDPLEAQLGDLAAVSDQSGSYLVWRIAGPGAGALLQKGVAIDLHPDAFGTGASAVTVIAHMGVILWRPEGAEGFEVAAFRSYARDFEHWLRAQAL